MPGVITTLDVWFGQQMIEKLYNGPPWRNQGGLMLGFPIWGRQYVDNFFDYSLPSLLAPENAEALAGRSRLTIFVPHEDAPRMWQGLKPIERTHGIELDISLLSPEVMSLLKQSKQNAFWILGTTGNLCLHKAGRSGMSFHMLQPDHVYSERFFPKLFELAKKYQSLAQTTISANVETAGPELNRRRNDKGLLAIPARDLGDLGWRHLHARSKRHLITPAAIPDDMPYSHLMLWQARDKLMLYCWHVNATYISPDLCANAPVKLLSTMDTQLPDYMPGDIGFPDVGDEMTFIELSDKTAKVSAKPPGFTFNHFARFCLDMVNYGDEYLPFMKTPSEVPIYPQDSWTEEDEIRACHARILEGMEAAKVHVTPLLFPDDWVTTIQKQKADGA